MPNLQLKNERKNISDTILTDGEGFLRILIGLSVVGALISLMIGLFVKRSITKPVRTNWLKSPKISHKVKETSPSDYQPPRAANWVNYPDGLIRSYSV